MKDRVVVGGAGRNIGGEHITAFQPGAILPQDVLHRGYLAASGCGQGVVLDPVHHKQLVMVPPDIGPVANVPQGNDQVVANHLIRAALGVGANTFQLTLPALSGEGSKIALRTFLLRHAFPR